MATCRFAGRLLRLGQRAQGQVCRRTLHTTPGGKGSGAGPRSLILGAAGVAGAYALYRTCTRDSNVWSPVSGLAGTGTVHAATKFLECQPSVFSDTKNHALYLWVHLKPSADAKACMKTAAKLQQVVDEVCPPDLRDESDEVWAGVGFGPDFYAKVGGKAKKAYKYPDRKGPLGPLPSTGGDIFIHAKSDTPSKLFELAHLFLSRLPKDSVAKFEDTYSFVYRNGRDLSGFIDGTENAADEDSRQKIAVEPETGGSYVIAMKWIHKFDIINKERDDVMSKWVGRAREDSTELMNKLTTSHVARMTGGTAMEQKKKFEIVRQSMPYGNLHDKAGLFFIGYAASPENFEYMLKRMVGQDDKHSDDIMRLTECVQGTYFYFPGAAELKKFA